MLDRIISGLPCLVPFTNVLKEGPRYSNSLLLTQSWCSCLPLALALLLCPKEGCFVLRSARKKKGIHRLSSLVRSGMGRMALG